MKKLIAFGIYLTGHDEDTILQMYNDWEKFSPINFKAPDKIPSVIDNEDKKKICPECGSVNWASIKVQDTTVYSCIDCVCLWTN